ncbi:MAG: hypothetical protein IT304_02085 [Dehalococcoidia bacterium]|nr:hypothetical protein [Dehalococcoidia bacterium]
MRTIEGSASFTTSVTASCFPVEAGELDWLVEVVGWLTAAREADADVLTAGSVGLAVEVDEHAAPSNSADPARSAASGRQKRFMRELLHAS